MKSALKPTAACLAVGWAGYVFADEPADTANCKALVKSPGKVQVRSGTNAALWSSTVGAGSLRPTLSADGLRFAAVDSATTFIVAAADGTSQRFTPPAPVMDAMLAEVTWEGAAVRVAWKGKAETTYQLFGLDGYPASAALTALGPVVSGLACSGRVCVSAYSLTSSEAAFKFDPRQTGYFRSNAFAISQNQSTALDADVTAQLIGVSSGTAQLKLAFNGTYIETFLSPGEGVDFGVADTSYRVMLDSVTATGANLAVINLPFGPPKMLAAVELSRTDIGVVVSDSAKYNHFWVMRRGSGTFAKLADFPLPRNSKPQAVRASARSVIQVVDEMGAYDVSFSVGVGFGVPTPRPQLTPLAAQEVFIPGLNWRCP